MAKTVMVQCCSRECRVVGWCVRAGWIGRPRPRRTHSKRPWCARRRASSANSPDRHTRWLRTSTRSPSRCCARWPASSEQGPACTAPWGERSRPAPADARMQAPVPFTWFVNASTRMKKSLEPSPTSSVQKLRSAWISPTRSCRISLITASKSSVSRSQDSN